MAKPAIVVVDDDRASLDRLNRELTARYGLDYSVVVESSAPQALRTLRTLVGRGEEVALVLADQSMTGMIGRDLLVEAPHLPRRPPGPAHRMGRRSLEPRTDHGGRRPRSRRLLLGEARLHAR